MDIDIDIDIDIDMGPTDHNPSIHYPNRNLFVRRCIIAFIHWSTHSKISYFYGIVFSNEDITRSQIPMDDIIPL